MFVDDSLKTGNDLVQIKNFKQSVTRFALTDGGKLVLFRRRTGIQRYKLSNVELAMI